MTKGLLVDLAPLRGSPDFRRLWLGSLASNLGGQMTVFAVALQVYLITGSSLAVGGVGLASAVPGIVFGLLGGSVIDAVDRRLLVLRCSTVQLALSAALAAQAFAGLDQVSLLYLLVALQSLVGSVNAPARQTFMPRLLPPEQVPAGAAVTMLAMHTSLVTGPALGGLLTAAGGLRFCYLVDAVSFLAALYGVYRLPPMRPDGGGTRAGLRSTLDGLTYIRRSRVLAGTLLADLNATVLAMPVALFPAINDERFAGSPRTLGLMTSALGVGGIVGSALSGPLSRIARQGRAMLATVAGWGVALAGFAVIDGLAATLGLLVLAGVADVSSVVLRTTMVTLATSDDVRGRVNSTNFVVGAMGPQLGNFRAGAVASATSPGASAFGGAIACVLGAGVLALTLPALRRYRPVESSTG